MDFILVSGRFLFKGVFDLDFTSTALFSPSTSALGISPEEDDEQSSAARSRTLSIVVFLGVGNDPDLISELFAASFFKVFSLTLLLTQFKEFG